MVANSCIQHAVKYKCEKKIENIIKLSKPTRMLCTKPPEKECSFIISVGLRPDFQWHAVKPEGKTTGWCDQDSVVWDVVMLSSKKDDARVGRGVIAGADLRSIILVIV